MLSTYLLKLDTFAVSVRTDYGQTDWLLVFV